MMMIHVLIFRLIGSINFVYIICHNISIREGAHLVMLVRSNLINGLLHHYISCLSLHSGDSNLLFVPKTNTEPLINYQLKDFVFQFLIFLHHIIIVSFESAVQYKIIY